MIKKSLFNWSGGKDSALALYHILKEKEYAIEKLVTTVNNSRKRVVMHGVRESLLFDQSDAVGIPIEVIYLPDQVNMDDYERSISERFMAYKDAGVTHSIYGDIFLEDLRSYRERQLQSLDIEPVFPLWGKNTAQLMDEFITLGFKALIVCANNALIGEGFVGEIIDHHLLKALPKHVDPCGENGEFHTFVFDGPIFKRPVRYDKGEKVYRSYPSPVSDKDEVGFWFIDLLLKK